jgi:hypothetical protein
MTDRQLNKAIDNILKQLKIITEATIEGKEKLNPKNLKRPQSVSKFPKGSSFLKNTKYQKTDNGKTLLEIIFPNYAQPLSEGIGINKNIGVQYILPWVQKKKIQFRNNKGKFLSYLTTAIIITKAIRRRGTTGYKFLSQLYTILNNSGNKLFLNNEELLSGVFEDFDKRFVELFSKP